MIPRPRPFPTSPHFARDQRVRLNADGRESHATRSFLDETGEVVYDTVPSARTACVKWPSRAHPFYVNRHHLEPDTEKKTMAKAVVSFAVVIKMESADKGLIARFRRIQKDMKKLGPVEGDDSHGVDVVELLEGLVAISRRARASVKPEEEDHG